MSSNINNFKKISLGLSIALISFTTLANKGQIRMDDTIVLMDDGGLNFPNQPFSSKKSGTRTGGFKWLVQPTVDSFSVRYTYYPSLGCSGPVSSTWARSSDPWRWVGGHTYGFIAEGICNSLNDTLPDQCSVPDPASLTLTSINVGGEVVSPCMDMLCNGTQCIISTPTVTMPPF